MKYIQLAKQFYKDKSQYDTLYEKRFFCESTVHIPILIHGNEAFFTYSEEVIQLISKIYKLDKLLGITLRELPVIAKNQFYMKCLIDEIKSTNDIEGVYSTRREIKELLINGEAVNYRKRLYGLLQKYLILIDGDEIPIESCQDIRKLYDDLLLWEIKEENPDNQPDGMFFRKEIVYIQAADLKIIHNGVYPEETIISYMEEGLKLLNHEDVNKLAAISAFHYLLGYIHPFYDGNGRLNRFISSYLLSKELTPMVGYGISNTIYKERSKYYKAFEMANEKKNRGDITPFVIIFLELIYQSIAEMEMVLADKLKQLQYYGKEIERLELDNNLKSMLYIILQNTLFGEDGMAVEEIAEAMQLSVPSIRNYLRALDRDVLSVTKEGRRKLYDINLDYFMDA